MAKLDNVVENVLRESVVEDAAELVGIEKEEAADRISGLSFANYLELGNAVEMEDAETAREILGTVSEIEEGLVDEEKLLDKPTPTLKDLAKKHNVSLGDMGSQLAMGIKAEKEHTSDMLVAKEIALDHLNELPDYYTKLEKMEEGEFSYGKTDPLRDQPIPGKKLAKPMKSWGEILWKLSDRKLTKLYNQKMDDCGGAYNPGTSAVTPIKKEMVLRGLLTEADNPYAAAKAAPPPAAIPPSSAASSIDALAQPNATSNDVDNEENQRKEVDDLTVGDDIEVIDISGDPTAVTVKNPRGPGETLIVQTDKGEEHMIKKIAVSGTPKLQELAENFEREMNEDYYDIEGEGASLAQELGTYGWIVYISWRRDDLDFAMYKNIDKDNNRGDYRFLKVDKATGSWQTQRSKYNDDMPTESGDAAELMHVIKAIEASETVDEARNASNTEHSGAKKGKGGYYGRKKDAKSDSNKKRRANDKAAMNEGSDFYFFVEPDGRGGGEVRTNKGDNHDYFDDIADAKAEAERLNQEYGKVDESVLSDHVKIEYTDPEGRYIIVTAGVAGYWAVGQDKYYNSFDRQSFKTLEDAMRDAEETAAGLGEGKYDYSKRDKGKGAGTSSPMYDGGAKNRKNRKAFRKAEKAKAHQARMRGELVDEDILRIRELAGILEEGMFGVYRKAAQTSILNKDEGHTAAASAKVKRGGKHVTFKSKGAANKWVTDNSKGENMFVRKVSKSVKETSSAGGTGAGAIASAPAAMNGIHSRKQSIYGKTNKKPKPKERTKESTEDGIGRNKK